jgi:hypothetical protein
VETEAGGTARRHQLEALGLLAYDADPVEPGPERKARLMAAIGRETAATPSPGDPPVLPFEVSRRRAPAPAAAGHRITRRGDWAGLAAAVVALAALGLAGVLWFELDRSREALARLEREQRELTSRLEVQQLLAREVGRLGEVVEVATTQGVEICPLRPMSADSVASGAFAVLYMPPGDKSWYLVASDLGPAPGGVYKVWLDTPEGPMPGGVIEVGAGGGPAGRATVSIPQAMLEGRRMLSVTITLEPSPEVESPTGPMVLFGDEKMQVL